MFGKFDIHLVYGCRTSAKQGKNQTFQQISPNERSENYILELDGTKIRWLSASSLQFSRKNCEKLVFMSLVQKDYGKTKKKIR